MKFNILLRGQNYVFETKNGLFSKDGVDSGTKLLIDKIKVNSTDIILDLGCGWGPIGIVAAKLANKGKVYMVDIDIRAIKYSQLNAQINNVKNIEVKLSDGFENLEEINFDVILSNPPSHSSNETLIEFIEESKKHLKNKGKLYFVVEKRISSFIKRELKRVFDNKDIITTSVKHNLFVSIN